MSDRGVGRAVQLRPCSVTLISDPASLREPGKVVGSDGAMETLHMCLSWRWMWSSCQVMGTQGLASNPPSPSSQLCKSPRHHVTLLWFQLILLKVVRS